MANDNNNTRQCGPQDCLALALARERPLLAICFQAVAWEISSDIHAFTSWIECKSKRARNIQSLILAKSVPIIKGQQLAIKDAIMAKVVMAAGMVVAAGMVAAAGVAVVTDGGGMSNGDCCRVYAGAVRIEFVCAVSLSMRGAY